jgi:hypothetical protein
MDIDADAELALHPLGGDVDVRFTDAGEDHLVRVGIAVHLERRVLFDDALERGAELILVGA